MPGRLVDRFQAPDELLVGSTVAHLSSKSMPASSTVIEPAPPVRRSPTTRPVVKAKFINRPAARRSQSVHSRSAVAVMANPPVLSQADYDALPTSIQRKYFSSLERLRIVENAAHQQAKTQALARGQTLTRRAPPRSNLKSLPRLATRPSFSQLRTSSSSSREQRVSPAETQWFLSLPEKVRRQQFSQEEQVVLSAGQDTTTTPTTRRQPSFTAEHWSEKDPVILEPFDPEPKVLGRRSSLDAGALNYDHHHSKTHVVTAFDEMLSPVSSAEMSPVGQRSTQLPGRPLTRRTMSLTTPFVPFRSSTSSAPTSVPVSGRNSLSVIRSRMNPTTGRPLAPPLSVSTVDPEAKHYQDPDARKKVKNFLASPAKFDEAIEFGFPAERQEQAAEPQIPTPIKTSYDVATFLNDESISCMDSMVEEYYDDREEEDEEDDNSTLGDVDSPATPSDTGATFRHGTRLVSDFSSFDSSVLGPSWPNLKPHSIKEPLIESTREMTLRMTLTRPDLRATEDEIYGWQRKSLARENPLALEDLPPVTDDTDGSHSPFALQSRYRKQSLVGRLMTKVKLGRSISSGY